MYSSTGFQVALVVKNPPANAGNIRDSGLIHRLGRSPGGDHVSPLQYSCLENQPHEQYRRQNDRTLKDELPRSVGAQYATGDQWRNNSRKNEGMEPKQKQHPVVNETGGGSRVRCCKEQYCIGTWNVRSMIKPNWKWSNRRWQE